MKKDLGDSELELSKHVEDQISKENRIRGLIRSYQDRVIIILKSSELKVLTDQWMESHSIR